MGTPGLRLLIYDRTCRGRHGVPGLSTAWAAGRQLYRWLGRVDQGFGARTWAEALDWLATFAAPTPIAEVQYWGHGRWGQVLLGGEILAADALSSGHPHHARLAAIKARMLPGDAGLWWFRTCETFGGPAGHDFARRWTRFFGCRAAGHTHVIGIWQSGLHTLAPGRDPGWSPDEGLPVRGRTGAPSRRKAPNTVSFLRGEIPRGF